MKQINQHIYKNRILPGFQVAIILIGLTLSACSPTPASPTLASTPITQPTIDTSALVTQIYGTLVAQFTQAAALQASATPTPTPLASAVLTAQTSNPTAGFSITTGSPSPSPLSTAVRISTSAPGQSYPALFAVIHVITSVNIDDVAAACPPGYNFQFSATISTNGPGDVTYNWEFSDGSKTDNQTLTYTSASSQTVNTSWKIGDNGRTPGDNPYKGWARVTIVTPNQQVFPRSAFNFRCQ